MRRSASEIIRNLENRIARLERQASYSRSDRNASIEKASVYKMRRAPKNLKKAIQAYLLSGGVNVDIRDLKKEKVSPELSTLLQDVGLPPSARMTVFELFERFMPQAYHDSFEGWGDERTQEEYQDDLKSLILELKRKGQKSPRAPKGSKIRLQIISARGGELISKMFRKTDDVFVADFGLETVRTYTAEEALEKQMEEIARHGKPLTDFLASKNHPIVKRLYARSRWLDERGVGMN